MELKGRCDADLSKDRLKIGIFVDTYFPMIDGVIVCVDNYAKYLSKHADVTVFTTVVDKSYEDTSEYKIVRCTSLPIKVADYALAVPSLDIDFWEELRHADLDIVHINSPFTVGISGMRYARQHRIPAVATMHSQFETDFKRALKLNPLVELAKDALITVFDSADEVWVPNSAVGDVYKSYGGKKEPKVRYNATDMLPVSDPAAAGAQINEKYGFAEDENVFLFVGRLIRQKNVFFLADAAAELKKLTDKKFRLVYVGSGPDEEELKEYVETLGIFENVLFTGRITERDELAAMYSRSDVFAFPSLYDANSLVQIEAASQATPTLFLHGAVTSSTAKDGVSGYFSDNDSVSYANKLLEIMSNPIEHEKICEAAYNDVYKSWSVVVPQMLSDYHRIITEYPKPGLIEKIKTFFAG